MIYSFSECKNSLHSEVNSNFEIWIIMKEKIKKGKIPSSNELAANNSLIPVWDPAVPFPSPQEMRDPDIVTHITVERAKKGGYHYLHEATIVWHRDRFYMGWANHRTNETGDHDELIRGCTSLDALHWSEPTIWAKSPLVGATSINHPLLFSHKDVLYGFFVCWREEHIPTTELFILNEASGEWEWQKESTIPRFVPFCTPQLMDNGNWIIGGENHWDKAAVAISKGDDLAKWEMVNIPRPDDLTLFFPETAIVNRGNNKLLAFCRPQQKNRELPDAWTAPVSESNDGGRTWSTLGLSNFPLSPSQPFAGRLSTGQNYLLTNNLEDGRTVLSIALTDSDGGLFRHIFKVRHQQWPAIRLFGGYKDEGSSAGKPTEWSYPNAFEYEGNLYIAYSQGKEDCALTIIPVEALNV